MCDFYVYLPLSFLVSPSTHHSNPRSSRLIFATGNEQSGPQPKLNLALGADVHQPKVLMGVISAQVLHRNYTSPWGPHEDGAEQPVEGRRWRSRSRAAAKVTLKVGEPRSWACLPAKPHLCLVWAAKGCPAAHVPRGGWRRAPAARTEGMDVTSCSSAGSTPPLLSPWLLAHGQEDASRGMPDKSSHNFPPTHIPSCLPPACRASCSAQGTQLDPTHHSLHLSWGGIPAPASAEGLVAGTAGVFAEISRSSLLG